MTRFQSVSWRARAYQGSVLGSDPSAPEVSQFSGEAALGPDPSMEDSFNERVVSYVRCAIEARLNSAGMNGFDPATALRPFMTVESETLKKVAGEQGDCWSQVARLDFITDGLVVHAGIWVEAAPERLLPTIPVQDGDTVWQTFVRLLAQPSNEFASE
jgi:hypothetical protein